MAEPAEVITPNAPPPDPGLDKGIEKLTPEKIKKVIDRVLSAETGARIKAYVDTCVR
jgi:hypothetical protein